MRRYVLLLWLVTFSLMANMELYPKKECGLFNNLKHTKNRGQEVLKLDRTYEMLKHHKEQYLLKVEYATPSQRWVDDDCLSLRPLRGTPLYALKQDQASKKAVVQEKVSLNDELQKADKNIAAKPQKHLVQKNPTSKQNLLALSWHNAFCETHRNKKECKRGLSNLINRKSSDTQFVLHGLWPQPRNNAYCNVDKALVRADKNRSWRDLPYLALDEEIEDALEKVMPGYASQLHKHEWIKHGTCYGTDANAYYADAISLVNQVNTSAIGKFFTQNIGKRISLKQVRTLADKTLGKGTGNRIELQCKRGLVTELWLHLGTGSDDLATLLKRGKKTRSRCKGGLIDKAGFGR